MRRQITPEMWEHYEKRDAKAQKQASASSDDAKAERALVTAYLRRLISSEGMYGMRALGRALRGIESGEHLLGDAE